MTTALAFFVKTPCLSPVKTRLAQRVGEDQAMEFYLACLEVFDQIATEVHRLSDGDIIPYWAVAEEAGLSSDHFKNHQTVFQGQGKLGHRLDCVYTTLLKKHDAAILMGADSPQVTPEFIIDAAQNIHPGQFVVGPTHDGGFYFFGGAFPLPSTVWTGVTYSTEKTWEELRAQISLCANVKLLDQYDDVDRWEDLKKVESVLENCHLSAQKELLEWMKKVTRQII